MTLVTYPLCWCNEVHHRVWNFGGCVFSPLVVTDEFQNRLRHYARRTSSYQFFKHLTIACLSLEMGFSYADEDHTTIIWSFLSPLRTSWEAASSKGHRATSLFKFPRTLRLAAQQSQKNVKPLCFHVVAIAFHGLSDALRLRNSEWIAVYLGLFRVSRDRSHR